MLTTDWLNSRPVFLNRARGIYSVDANEVISKKDNIDIHLEGLSYFLRYGFSAFGLTPIADVNFLEPNMSVTSVNNDLSINKKSDPFFLSNKILLSEGDIFEKIVEDVNRWVDNLNNNETVILPLSGGLDSRLLLWSIRDKERVKCFTYGISRNQSRSYEVQYAKYLCEKHNVRWEHIELLEYNKYIHEWCEIFGPVVHAHGMYHFELYKKICSSVPGPKALLSGIFGDVFAGSVPKIDISSVSDVDRLQYTHGINFSGNPLYRSVPLEARLLWFKRYKKELKHWGFQNLSTIRSKMMLIRYLLHLPQHFGMTTYSPFIDEQIGISMLLLDENRRQNRVWQQEFIQKTEFEIPPKKKLICSYRNTLDLDNALKAEFEPIVECSSLNFLNDHEKKDIVGFASIGRIKKLYAWFCSIPKIQGLLSKLGFQSNFLMQYYKYLIWVPIHIAFQKKGEK